MSSFSSCSSGILNEDGQLLRDDGVPIEGVFAVGDVRNSWNQIPIGWEDAEKAIVSIFSTVD